jgi:antitoxin component YwqK of YwqJK toxin-antitoxin module
MTFLVALALALGTPAPFSCPPGTVHLGAQPMAAFEEWCEAPGPDGRGRREGPARTYYEDGTVWVDSAYHDGLLEGRFVEWYRGGKKAREGAYQGGLRTGSWTFYYEDGTLQEEARFTGGVPDGRFADYWPNGKPRNAGWRCLGAQCGKWSSYDEAGRLIGTVEYGEQRTTP